MEYGDKFKKAVFGGFNREDVLRCFEEMNAKNTEELETVQQERDTARRELSAQTERADTLEADKKRLEEELTACKTALAEAQAEVQQTKEELDRQKKEMQSLKALNSELSVKRGILEENNRSLKKQMEELSDHSAEKNPSLEIGDLMVEAKKTADQILMRAQQKSDQTDQEILERTRKINSYAEQFAQKMAEFREKVRKETEAVNIRFENLEKEAASMLAGFKEQAGAEENREKNPYGFLFRKQDGAK